MANMESDGRGQTIQKHSGSATVRQPEITGDEEPLAVIWGTFSGPGAHFHGAIYIEIEPNREIFKRFNLAMFENKAGIDNFDPEDRPLLFQQSVTKHAGANGEVTQTDFEMVKASIEKYVFSADNRSNLYDYLENYNQKELSKWFHDLLSTFIRKGKLFFTLNGQLSTPKALSRSMKAALSEKHGRGDFEEEKEEQHEEDAYHQLSIVTLPLRGIPPDELMPEEEIYVRALGAVVEHFPEELRSDRYEYATVPLEAVVETIRATPNLPPSYEGNPEDYFEIIARFGKGETGRGFVYKTEKVKPVAIPDDELQADRLIPILLGLGILFSVIALVAFFIFG